MHWRNPCNKRSRFTYTDLKCAVQPNLLTPDWAVNDLFTLTVFKFVINFTHGFRLGLIDVTDYLRQIYREDFLDHCPRQTLR